MTLPTTTRPRPDLRTGLDVEPVRTGLHIQGLTKVLGGRTIVDGFTLDVGHGELVALLGPSGCGKTTTLRMIAGFLEPDEGEVVINSTDVTHLGADKRPSAMVFQNYALWPHLTIFKNVAFPLTLRKLPRAEIRERVMAALQIVNLAHHADSRPPHISGGEQQRAALARAIVQEPEVLLLDEPLSNLDAKLRVRVREEIREIQQRLQITTVMVTHDQDEALAISDRVAVMNGGRIEQVSTPVALYREPASEFVASFIGSMNFLDGPDLRAARNARLARESGSGSAGGAPSTADRWSVRPEDVLFFRAEDGASGNGVGGAGDGCPAVVRRVLPHGHFSEIVLDADGIELRAVSSQAAADVPERGDRGTVQLRNVRHYRDGLLVGADA